MNDLVIETYYEDIDISCTRISILKIRRILNDEDLDQQLYEINKKINEYLDEKQKQ